MKKQSKKEIEDNLLETLNDFMDKYNIDEIEFGKNHKIKKINKHENVDD
jgi:ribosomal protein L7Ae-like RNA K-turn-binding protein